MLRLAWWLLVVLVLCAGVARAYPNMAQSIPNGKNVQYQGESWPAVGHSR